MRRRPDGHEGRDFQRAYDYDYAEIWEEGGRSEKRRSGNATQKRRAKRMRPSMGLWIQQRRALWIIRRPKNDAAEKLEDAENVSELNL